MISDVPKGTKSVNMRLIATQDLHLSLAILLCHDTGSPIKQVTTISIIVRTDISHGQIDLSDAIKLYPPLKRIPGIQVHNGQIE